MTNPPLFDFRDVSVGNGNARLLAGVTGRVPDGGITVVLGPSGSGKTTLLRLCDRLAVPSAGQVLYRGDDVATIDPLELRRRVGMVFQMPTLLGGTVRDNLLLASPEAGDDELVVVLGRVELPETFLDRQGDDLSGGEAQRVCLARTLVTRPETLLMDEPTASLDVGIRHEIEHLARSLADGGVPMLWVTHDLEQAAKLADHVIVLVDGVIRMSGGAEVLTGGTDEIVDAFLSGGEGLNGLSGGEGLNGGEVGDDADRG